MIYWHGTKNLKSRHNAFHWRTDEPTFAVQDPNCRTKAYSAWLATSPQSQRTTPWPTFRDAFVEKEKGKAGGFAANSGTLHGLSAKTEEFLRRKSSGLVLTAADPSSQPNHAGAYSRAGSIGGKSKRAV